MTLVFGDILKNVCQGADIDWAVIADGFVMYPVKVGYNTNVAFRRWSME